MPHEAAYWMVDLRDRPVVWQGGVFVEPSRLAFNPLTNFSNTEPFLYVVTSELTQYSTLLKQLGVRDKFEAADLAMVLRKLHAANSSNNSHRMIPLSTEKLVLCVGVLKLLVKMIGGGDDGDGSNDNDNDGDGSHDNDNDGKVGNMKDYSDDGDEKVVGGVTIATTEVLMGDDTPTPSTLGGIEVADGDAGKGGSGRDSHEKDTPTPPRVTLADLGPLYLPDKHYYLRLATDLYYDNAPWVSDSLKTGKSIHFVHSDLNIEESKTLGCRSLVEKLFEGKSLMGPGAAQLNAVLDNDSILEALTDVLSLADSLAATSFDVVYDMRLHPSESLMHPALAGCQGAAITIHIGGATLQTEDIIKYLTPSRLGQMESPHEASTGSMGDANNGSGDSDWNIPYPVAGKKLISGFAIADCLQIITGTHFFIIDPAGAHLPSDEPSFDDPRGRPGAPQALRPIGQRCQLDAEMLSRFPDQTLPFMRLPFRVAGGLASSRGYDGIVIRLPLRAAASAISSSLCNEEMVKSALKSFDCILEGSIVFSNSLLSGSCMHYHADPGEDVLEVGSTGAEGDSMKSVESGVMDYSYKLKTASSDRNARRQVRTSLSPSLSLFSLLILSLLVLMIITLSRVTYTNLTATTTLSTIIPHGSLTFSHTTHAAPTE